MLLGTYHFTEKGVHLIDIESEDILSDKKQKNSTSNTTYFKIQKNKN